MTPDSQQIAIAEACGWKEVRLNSAGNVIGHSYDLDCSTRLVPNYLSDLNAMHEAEKTVPEGLRSEYESRLFSSKNAAGLQRSWHVVTATAAQRAEVFLRTVGKWDDAK